MEKEFYTFIRDQLLRGLKPFRLSLLVSLLLALPASLTPRTKPLQSQKDILEICQRREKKSQSVRSNISLSRWMKIEDFEKKAKKSRFTAWKGKNLLLHTSLIEPGPNFNSKRSLYVSIRRGRVQKFRIHPPKPIFIQGFVQKFSLYAKTLSGRVRIFMDIEDQNKHRFIVSLGELKTSSSLGYGSFSLSWKKLLAKLPTQIKQRSLQPTITTKGFPKNLKKDPHTQEEKKEGHPQAGVVFHGLLLYLDSPSARFFVDDLSAQVRPYAQTLPLDFGMSHIWLALEDVIIDDSSSPLCS